MMLRCDECQVDVIDNVELCPLCHNRVTGETEDHDHRFPVSALAVPDGLRSRIAWALFGTICAVVVCLLINVSVPHSGWWSLIVLGGAASVWAEFTIIWRRRSKLPNGFLWQVVIVTAIGVVWDLLTGWHSWSLAYLLPILCVETMLAVIITAVVRAMHAQDYIVYLLLDALFSLVPMILVLTGVVSIMIPAAICAGLAIMCLAWLIIFEGRTLLAELVRRFHW